MARVARGESPDPHEYLERAGPGRDDLAQLMEAYLQAAPRREPDPIELVRSSSGSHCEPGSGAGVTDPVVEGEVIGDGADCGRPLGDRLPPREQVDIDPELVDP
jgi:hypothetical protein